MHLDYGSNIQDAVNVLALTMTTTSTRLSFFTSLEEAKAKFNEIEQALWEEVRACWYQPDGKGMV